MKYGLLVIVTLGAFACTYIRDSESPTEKGAKIIIEVEFPKDFGRDQIYLESAPLQYVMNPSWRARKPTIKANLAKWTLFSDSPLVVNLTPMLGLGNKLHLYEPGDSIHIDMEGGEPVYSGNNAGKFNMLQEINRRELSLPVPLSDPKKLVFVASLQDYLEWNSYLNTKLALLQSIFESYKEHVTPFAYDYLRAGKIAEIEYTRLMKFGGLRNASREFGVSGDSLGKIFDSTSNNKYAEWLHSYEGRVTKCQSYFYDYVRKSVERRYNFDTDHDSLSGARRKMLYADLAKKTYKGDVLQSCLVFLLTEQGLKEHTYKHYTPEIDTLLTDFYAQPGYPEHKRYVKEYEQKVKNWIVTKNESLKTEQ
jgi:hypothetical protein